MKTRINKFLALSGIGSRRKVEVFITERRIKINGKIMTDLAYIVDEENDVVEYRGQILKADKSYIYLLLNKPNGYITTTDDEFGRPTVMDLIQEKYKRKGVFPIGRLDKDTEGLLLFTNDGKFSERLQSPKYKIPKEYIVELDKELGISEKKKAERGIFIHQLKLRTRPAEIEYLQNSKKFVKIKITEGKKRQIRYTFQNLGYEVRNLKRVSIGPIVLSNINRGDNRLLKDKEITALKKSMGLED